MKGEFRKPFGDVCSSMAEISAVLEGKKVVCVGDSVSYLLLKSDIEPDIVVYDRKEMRKEVSQEKLAAIENFCVSELTVRNPPSTITSEAWLVVKKSLQIREKVKIFVDGEEDLLVLPFVLEGDENLVILYGLRDQGFVLVKVNKFIKEKCRELLKRMSTGR